MLKKINKGNDTIEFFVGLLMMCVGGYLFMQNVMVDTTMIFHFSLFGHRLDGLIFVPLIASLIFLFYKYNRASKICCFLSVMLIFANVIANLRMSWLGTTLFATIIIFILLFGGLGLVLRTLFTNPKGEHGKTFDENK